MNRSVHTNTPVLSVSDPRGLTIATVNYWRDKADAVAQARCERHLYDAVGRLEAEWDPRLAMDDSAPANLTRTRSLNHTPLATESVDAGWRVSLFAETGQLIQTWDAGGRVQLIEYDQRLRPSAVFEQGCTQRYEYARAEEHFADHNQCGQLIRHDDTAGTRQFEEYGLAGEVLTLRQHFLQALDEPDWPLLINQRDALLEPGDGVVTAFRFNALGDLTVQVDAQGHRQYFNQTLDGQLREAGLLLNGKVEPQLLVRDIRYNAQGRIEQQTARNQVVSLFDYRPEDGRLTRLRARHLNGRCLQDLNYGYDPVGNILSIEDKALPVRFFANQRIESITRYIYDSLSQLIAATGWETGSDNRGPTHREDPRAVANYRQTYRYDEGGNLLELTHQGPQQHGRVLTAAKYSNRCLPLRDGRPPTEAEIAAAFDHNGNLLALDNARTLHWDVRNQLHQVTPVERDSHADDTERYVYAADGMRQRKVRMLQTGARAVISETRYLPGLETRDVDGARLNVITLQAGRMTVQVLHWESLPSRLLANDQYRYCLGDHLGSCALELDSEARVVSRETYHPYGSTALSERGDSNEESYRTLRYSGQERDATGLYYYGFRYYIPWLQRWSNADPAGPIDGLNLYRMVRNSPATFRDFAGLAPTKKNTDSPLPASASLFQRVLPGWLKKNNGVPDTPLHVRPGNDTQVYVSVPQDGGAPRPNVVVSRERFPGGTTRIKYVGANPDGSEEQNSATHGYIDYLVRDGPGERVADIHLFDAKPEGKGYGSLLLLELAYDAEEQSIQRIEASSVARNATGFYLLAGFHPHRQGHDAVEGAIPGPIDFWMGDSAESRLERLSNLSRPAYKFKEIEGADGMRPLERFDDKWHMARNSAANWEGEIALIKEQAKLATMRRGYFKHM